MSNVPHYCRACDFQLIDFTVAQCPECGTKIDFSDPTTFSLIRFGVWRQLLRWAQCTFVVVAFTWFVVLMFFSGSGRDMMLWGFLSVPLTLVFMYLVVALVTAFHIQRHRLPIRLVSFSVLVLVLWWITLLTQWPLDVSFKLCEGSFDALADAQTANRQVNTPTWIGIFHVTSVGTFRNGATMVWLDSGPSGPIGFARIEPESDAQFANRKYLVQLSDDWYFYVED